MISGLRCFGSGLILVILNLLLGMAEAKGANTSSVELIADVGGWHLAGYLSVAGQPIDAISVLDFTDDHLFAPHPDIPAWGFSSTPQWVRFSLRSQFDEPTDWWLEVSPPFTDYLTLYWIDNQGRLQTQDAGDLIPIQERLVNLPQQVFPITLEANEQRIFILRVQGTNPLFADIRLWENQAFLEYSQRQNFFMAGYLAVLALMTLLGILYAGMLRNGVYALYTIYVLTQLGLQISHTGYLAWLVPLPWTRLPDLLASASVAISLGIFALIFTYITRMHQDFPRLSRYHLSIAWTVALVGVIFVLFDRYMLVSYWIQIYILMLTAFAVTFSIYRLLTGEYRLGSIYLAVFGVLAVGVILRILRDQGVLPNNFWTQNSIYLGTLAHLVAMQFVITLGIDQSRKANERALEERVKQRTRDLQERNSELLHINQQNLALQSELKTSLEKESKTRQSQQDFLRMVSNEFRSPLSVIDGALILLNMQHNTDTQTRSGWLERIRGAQQRLVSLVDSSHWDQRLADEEWKPALISIQLLPWMLQMTENLRRMYNPKQFVLQADANVALTIDPDILKMLLQGLVDAVVQNSTEDAPVRLWAQIKESHVVLRVCATGNALLPVLFEQLNRRYSEMGRHASSSGLYLAGAAARKLGGEIDYKVMEQGACFIVTLPLQIKLN